MKSLAAQLNPTLRPGQTLDPEVMSEERPSGLLHAHALQPLPAPSRRVLVLEDEPFCARAYSLALTREGFEVDTVGDGETALQRLLAQSYCAVVADLCLPGMSGLELLRCVRVHDLDTIVLLVTAAADFATATEALRHGASQLLLKPLHSRQLVGEVRRASRLHELAVRRRQAMRLLTADQLEADSRRAREQRFERAISSLRMAFQPILDREGRTFGYEALLRSGDPAFKGPLDMIAAAEQLDRLHALGRACRAEAARAFQAAPSDALLFVNLHAHDLLDDDLLRDTNPLAPMASRVVLELTERAPLGEGTEAPRRVARLRAMGFRIAIDDLGAGYAGLSSLVHLEPEFVKLDMSLVRDIHQSPIKHRLVSLMIDACRSLGITVVAEGVEVAAEHQCLVRLGCPHFQGYLLGKPGPLPPSLP